MRRALLFLLLLVPTIARADDGLRLDWTRESLTATWRHYTQILDGLEVVDAGVIERVDRDGSVHEVHRALAVPQPRVPRRLIAAREATLSLPPGIELEHRIVALNDGGVARPVWRIVVEEKPHQPYAHFVDVSTGELVRSEPLFVRVQARVFDVNPVAKLNRPDLRDHNNAADAVPDSAYSLVELDNLAKSGPLAGPYVAIVNLDDPVTAPADASQSLLFNRSQPQFQEVNAYFQLDRALKYLISLGYSGTRRLIDYQLPCDPHAVRGADNSFYVRGLLPGQGQLLFGDGGTDDAEDSDIVLHEFGHVIQDWIAPGTFTGLPPSAPPAIGEGFADYWSFSSTYAATAASGRDPFCIADWDARCGGDDASENCSYPVGADCLRRVDSTKTMADYVASDSADEHKNGEIWSSALREIFMAMTARYGLDAGKRTADTTILEGMFGVPPNPTFATMARKLIAADTALNGGANLQTICSAMTTRGILQAADCSLSPRGELTVIPPNDEGGAIPDNTTAGLTLSAVVLDARSIDKLYVDVDIAHTSRGDLQLTLAGPDGTSVRLQQPTLDRTADVRATFGLDAPTVDSLDVFHGHSAAGEWKLLVQDLRPRDSGSVRAWSLRIQFVGDAPVANRPFSFAARKFIAAVAHANGANGTTFVSDVHVFNRSAHEVDATLVFTPSGQEGWGHFAAVKLQLAPRQTAVLNDVVGHTMEASGTGNLDVVGDANDLIVTSRTYTKGAGGGTYGQFIPSELTTGGMSVGDAPRAIVPLRDDAAFRSNFGFSEVSGGSGSVHVVYFDAAGAAVGAADYPVLPFEHLQNRAASGASRAEVSVTSGDARVLAYGSMVDNTSGDGIYIEAQMPLPAGLAATYAAPAIHSDGVNGTAWSTDVWLDAAGGTATTLLRLGDAQAVFPIASGETRLVSDVVRSSFFASTVGLLRLTILAGSAVANTRTWTNSDRGSYGVAIPFVSTDLAEAPGAPPADIIHLESSPAFRTNIGVMEVGGAATTARLIVYDTAGREVGRGDISVGADSVSQIPLLLLTAARLYGARVSVQNVGTSGRLIAYGSVVDNISGDPIYIPAQ